MVVKAEGVLRGFDRGRDTDTECARVRGDDVDEEVMLVVEIGGSSAGAADCGIWIERGFWG